MLTQRALLRRCFHDRPTTEEQEREHDDRFCRQADAFTYALALYGEDAIGFAAAYRPTITYRGRAIRLGGLGDVCTDPGRRRSGIATAVVRAAVTELQAAECDLAYPCTDVTNPGMVRLYGQLGFVPLSRPHSYLGKSGTLCRPPRQ